MKQKTSGEMEIVSPTINTSGRDGPRGEDWEGTGVPVVCVITKQSVNVYRAPILVPRVRGTTNLPFSALYLFFFPAKFPLTRQARDTRLGSDSLSSRKLTSTCDARRKRDKNSRFQLVRDASNLPGRLKTGLASTRGVLFVIVNELCRDETLVRRSGINYCGTLMNLIKSFQGFK